MRSPQLASKEDFEVDEKSVRNSGNDKVDVLVIGTGRLH